MSLSNLFTNFSRQFPQDFGMRYLEEFTHFLMILSDFIPMISSENLKKEVNDFLQDFQGNAKVFFFSKRIDRNS